MSDSYPSLLYIQLAVLSSFIGGVLISTLGLFTAFLMRNRAWDELEHRHRAAFQDTRILLLLTLMPQAGLLVLPSLYRSPGDVPAEFAPIVLQAAIALLVVWIWAALKFCISGPRPIWLQFQNSVLLIAPGVVSTVFLFATYIVGHL